MRKFNAFKGEFKSSFLSCEKDTETIIKKLFVDSRPYSDELKKLLIINNPDCLSAKSNLKYQDKIGEYSVAKLIKDGYIKVSPKIELGENEEIKSYIMISFDNFSPNQTNPYYRDCTIMIDIICNTDCWEMDDYCIRPLKIAGYIDGILNESKLSGIGTLNFMGASELILSENLSGYCLIYSATHGVDDLLESEEDD